MAISSVAKTNIDGTLLGQDGAATPLDVTVEYEDGDFSLDGVSEHQAEVLKFLDRGRLYSVRKGNDNWPTYSFSAHVTDISDATDETIWDFVNGTAAFSTFTSTYSANADINTCKWTLTIEGTDHGDGADHTIVMDDCTMSIAFAEGQPDKVTISGEVLGTITAT